MLTAAPPPPAGSIVFDHVSPDGQRTQLFRERADGTGVFKVSRTGRTWFEPRWLEDGNIASFWDTGLAVVTPDGRIVKRIRIRRSTTRLAISPDGTWFAYVAEGCISARGSDRRCGTLWVGTLDGGPGRRLSPPGAVDIVNAFIGTAYTWSPNGRWIAYAGHHGLVVVDVGTGRRHLIGPTRFSTSTPDWSPDGSRILYRSGGSLVTIDPDGSGRRVVRGAGQAFVAQWSPDGRRIAWLQDDATHSAWVVFASDPDGSHRVRVGAADDYQTLVWSPDSRWLLVGGLVGERFRILPADGVGRVWRVRGGDHVDWER